MLPPHRFGLTMENQRLIVRCLPTATLSMMIEVLRSGIGMIPSPILSNAMHQSQAVSRARDVACSTMQVTWQSLDTSRGLATTTIQGTREVVTVITSTR